MGELMKSDTENVHLDNNIVHIIAQNGAHLVEDPGQRILVYELVRSRKILVRCYKMHNLYDVLVRFRKIS